MPAQTAAPAPPGEADAFRDQLDAYLRSFLKHRPLPASLREAIGYSLLAGGKRLRPLLVWQSCQAVGGNTASATAPAAALEMIHAFSLIHDDLPAMDDDDLRRGRPTLHRHTSEAMAILAGDALNTLAFELIVTRVGDAALAAGLVRELTTATSDMIAGQVYDTLPNPGDDADADGQPMDDLDRLERIHRHKTGALLRAACRMGAMCGHASAEQLEAVTDYAEAVGLMFQVVDDLLDVTSDQATLGKATQKDADAGKLTYPGLLGVEASQREVQNLRSRANAALDRLAQATSRRSTAQANSVEARVAPLRELCEYLAVRDR